MERNRIDYYCKLIMYFYFKMLFTVFTLMLFIIGSMYYFTENVTDMPYSNNEEQTEDAFVITSIQPIIQTNINRRVYEEKTDDAPSGQYITY